MPMPTATRHRLPITVRCGWTAHSQRQAGACRYGCKRAVRAVQRFSRHADVRTLQVYDDARTDLAGKVARLVAVASSNG